MRASFILDGILNELESGNADGVEGEVVSAAGVAHGERGHAEIFEGTHPGLEDGVNSFVFLQIDAANFSGAVIYVEISRDFRLLGLHSDWSGLAAQERGHVFHGGIVHMWA